MTECSLGHPLKAVDWRIERADKHLSTLDDERDRVIDKKNRRIGGHFERETSEYVFRFEGELPKACLGLVVGEFAHHLRAALDNLVWQLVLLRGGCTTRQTEFPIYESRKRYRGSGRRALRGVSTDDRALIEACQPFEVGERPSKTALALLAWLNNVDKHRFVHVGCAKPFLTGVQVFYTDGVERQAAGQFPWNPRPVKDVGKILDVDYISPITSEDRAELARVRIEPNGPDPQMEVDGQASVEIVLSDPRQALTIFDLVAIRNQIVAVIDAFRPRFDVVVGVSKA